MRLTIHLLRMCIKKQAEYRLNFALLCVAVSPIHLIQLLFSYIISTKFGGFAGWGTFELFFLYAVLLTSYSMAQIFFRQFRYLDNIITSGNLDLYYTRPQSIMYSLVFWNINVMEIISQLIPSLLILTITCIKLDIIWGIDKLFVLLFAILGGFILQACIFIIIGTISFWTLKSSELEGIYFSFKEFLNYPISAYGKYIVTFLTCLFPLAFINYYPSMYILDKSSTLSILNIMTFPVSVLMLVITLLIWFRAQRRYSSTGS